jgi:HlyD family secretion protein
MKRIIFYLSMVVFVAACSNDDNKSDAYGNFEADEIFLSAESMGEIMDIKVHEGEEVQKGQSLALIDTVQLHLQKERILAAMQAVASKKRNVQVQVDVLKKKKKNLLREKKRLENMFKDGAATQKQLDDVNGQIEVLESSIIATKTGLNTANTGLMSELKPLRAQLKSVEDKIEKCQVRAPINATVLVKYIMNGEFAVPGKPLFKIADLENIYLRAYISGSQLADAELGSNVKVLVDKGKDDYYEYTGRITWVSPKAEFTPKIVQTKEQRVNMVYAVKVLVKNDGKIKIGMPGELRFK